MGDDMEWSIWNAQDATREREEYWESIRRRREKGLINRLDHEPIRDRHRGAFTPPRSTRALSIVPTEIQSMILQQLPDSERRRLRGTSRIFMQESKGPRERLKDIAFSLTDEILKGEGLYNWARILGPLGREYGVRFYDMYVRELYETKKEQQGMTVAKGEGKSFEFVYSLSYSNRTLIALYYNKTRTIPIVEKLLDELQSQGISVERKDSLF